MARLPLLAGTRIPLVTVDDEALLVVAPPPLAALNDVDAAVREALRYPLSGPGLADLTTRGGRATVVIEPRSLPLPAVAADPRRVALAAVLDELTRSGVPSTRQTILVAGGLERRAGRGELESILQPTRARAFRGTVLVHDASSPELRAFDLAGAAPVRINEVVLETDLVVTMTAAETSERGGACSLLHACSADDIVAPAPAPTLLAPSVSPTGAVAGRIAAALARRAAVIGVSLVLDHPRLSGRFRGYPVAPASRRLLARSPSRHLFNVLPGSVRDAVLQKVARELRTVAVLAGPPAVSHAEALLRGISLRGSALAGEVDTVLVPLPWRSLHDPRERLNPLTVAATGLGHALRLWRDASPLRAGGTVVLLHDFRRTFGHGQAPYRDLFHLLREGASEARVVEARTAAASDGRRLQAYRGGTEPHPLLPFADWSSCRPVLSRAERVLVAGCRDAGAARALGLVPVHNLATALEMGRGIAGGSHSLAVLMAPPYAPVVVGEAS